MTTIINLHRLENEDMMAWQIRCCLAKRRKETDMDWIEIRDMLDWILRQISFVNKQWVMRYDTIIHVNSVATSIFIDI